ncbi:MAG: NarL family signal transduction histidine kinase [Bacteroidetes bacterium]|nr:MAG: NarL family signal transduction histidine kinase [Bacteroidota bacterium]
MRRLITFCLFVIIFVQQLVDVRTPLFAQIENANEIKSLFTQIHFYKQDHVTHFLNQIENQSFDKSLEIEKTSHIPFYTIFSGRLNEAERIMEAHYLSLLKKPSSASEIIQYLKVFSSILEMNNKHEKALSLWKEFSYNIDNKINTDISIDTYTQIVRIYNNLSLPGKSMLFGLMIDTLDHAKTSHKTLFSAHFEKIRLLLNNQPKEATALFSKMVTNRDKSNSEDLISLIQLHLLANALQLVDFQDYAFNDSFDSLITSIKDKHLIAVAYAIKANYINDSDVAEAYSFYKKSYVAFEDHQKKINGYLEFFRIQNPNVSTPRKGPYQLKSFSLTKIIFFGLFSIIFSSLFFWLFFNYLKFKKVIREKIGIIEKNRSEAEVKLIEAYANLDQLVKERESDLNKELIERERVDNELRDALVQAEEANYQKNAFLSNISHEIRTPLNGIIGFSSLLENELAILDQPDLFDYANSIQKSGEKLLHLLNNIIDISRLEANDIDFKLVGCNLPEMLEEVINTFKSSASEKGLRIVTEISKFNAIADQVMLAKVLSEMLDNAVKYTEKGFIRIKLDKIVSTGQVRIDIRDTGIGIDKNYLPDLFEAYRHESHGYSRQYQGAALGIPLSKQLVEKMGGSFLLDSQKAVGTTVSILLPESAKVEQKQQPIPNETNLLAEKIKMLLEGKRILIVEDDMASRKLISRFLEPHAEITAVADGDLAIKAIEEGEKNKIFFDLLVFDINLPDPWDGKKLLTAIKSNYITYANVPAIAETAYAMNNDESDILKSGFSAYLSKPIQRAVLYNEIIKLLDKK